MSIKPILFNTEMVRALLEGRITETESLVKFYFEVIDDERMDKR